MLSDVRIEQYFSALLTYPLHNNLSNSYRNVEFPETTKVYDLESNLESLAVCFCRTSKFLKRSD